MSVLYAGAEWVGCHPENFRAGRTDYNPPYQTFGVLAIALHHTATTFQGCIDTFLAAPASGRNHSAHFAVRNADGYRVQFVDTDDTAFALGYSQPNCYTINIESEQTWDFTNNVKTSDFSDALYASVGDLVRIVCTDKGVPIDADHIFGHNHWDPSNTCPADLDVARIITIAQGGDIVTPADISAIADEVLRRIEDPARATRADLEGIYYMLVGTKPDGTASTSLLTEIRAAIAALPAAGGGTEPAEPKTLTITGSITGTGTIQ